MQDSSSSAFPEGDSLFLQSIYMDLFQIEVQKGVTCLPSVRVKAEKNGTAYFGETEYWVLLCSGPIGVCMLLLMSSQRRRR